MKLTFFTLLILMINSMCFARGMHQNILFDQHFDNIFRTTRILYRTFDELDGRIVSGTGRTHEWREFEYIENGIYLIREESRVYFAYNINFGNEKFAEIRLIHLFTIGWNHSSRIFEKNRTENNLEVLAFLQRESEDRFIFEFYDNGRLRLFTATIREGDRRERIVQHRKIIRYNDTWMPEAIYSIGESGNVLNRSFFYDGVLRVLDRGFLNREEGIDLREIIIFDENRLKYHVIRHFNARGHHRNIPPKYFEKEENYFFTLSEFNIRGEVVKQTEFYPERMGRQHVIEYIKHDNNDNWTFKRVISENSFVEFRREILYIH